MSIDFTTVRSDMPDSALRRQFEMEHALRFLVQFVFGWSGHVTDLVIEDDVATLSARTRILGHFDNNTFTGTLEEMKPLLKAARFHLLLMKEHARPIYEQAVGALSEFTTNTLLLTSLTPIVAGSTVARSIYLSLLAERDATLPAKVAKLPTEELHVVVAFMYEGNSVEDILACV